MRLRWFLKNFRLKNAKVLDIGSNFVNNNQLPKAVEIFTQIINLDPNWAGPEMNT